MNIQIIKQISKIIFFSILGVVLRNNSSFNRQPC